MYPIAKLIVDFDETVSEKDTIHFIVNAAAENLDSEKEQFLAAWGETVEWYSAQYDRIFKEWFANREVSRGTGHSNLIEFLTAFEKLDSTSIGRVIERKFLAGITREKLRAVGQGVIKRPGVERVLSTMRTAGVKVEVLSANWSKTLIEGAMAGQCDLIIANNLRCDAFGRSTGQIDLHVVSARDKLKHFQARKSKTGPTLYIGDSISDFLVLLEADLGVLIGENQTALQVIERFRLPTLTVTDCEGQKSEIRKGSILKVDSWEELDYFLKEVWK